jgi:hypothetical protein
VIIMLCALVLTVVLAAACFLAWPKVRRTVHETATLPVGHGAVGAGVPRPSPQTLEGTLTLQLLTGELSASQYRHAMAAIATRDAERHPMAVPPEPNPPEAA